VIINILCDIIAEVVDGAPAHRSRQTVAFLRLHVPEFVEPENWQTNSPDLNPVDYSIWEVLHGMYTKQVCSTFHSGLSFCIADL